MDESKMTNYLLVGIAAMLLLTYLFVLRINLGTTVDFDAQIIAAINV